MSEQLLSRWHGVVVVDASHTYVSVRPAVRDAVIAEVAEAHRVSPDAILGKSRLGPIARARQEVMWRLRDIKGADNRPKHSYPIIARALGLEDHTTVLHGVRRHAARLAAQ